MIRFSNVSYQYQEGNTIISNLSFSLSSHKSIAIIGNSGCGKTTLLHLIAGILKPANGTVTLETDKFSYLMQDITLLPYYNALENSVLSVFLRDGYVDEKIKGVARQLLNKFGISTDSFLKFPFELSGGMKQRIGLVQTLLPESDLFLLDEPFNAIDINKVRIIENYIWQEIIVKNKVVVFVTHNIEQVLRLCDIVLVMKPGGSISIIHPNNSFTHLSPDLRSESVYYNNLYIEVLDELKQ